MICAIKPSGKSLRRLLRHCYLPVSRSGREVESIGEDVSSRVVARINGSVGAMTMRPADDARGLAGDVTGRSQYRHVVLSCEDTTESQERKDCFRALVFMASHWMARFAPDSPYLGIAHDDRTHPHLHLIIKNEGADGGCLSWSKDTVKSMQSMTWVPPELKTQFGIESGRGQGINPPEYSSAPYPLSKNLDAKWIASLTTEEINEHTRQGTIKAGRINRRGEITSIEYNGRRIRLSTIRGLAEPQGYGRGIGPNSHTGREGSKRRRQQGNRSTGCYPQVRLRRVPQIG